MPHHKVFEVGSSVVAGTDTVLEGANPFMRLLVTAVHRDGTVDVQIVEKFDRAAAVGSGAWERVDPSDLITIH